MENIATIADSGFIIALLNRQDKMNSQVTAIYKILQKPILLPQTVLVEVAYLVGRDSTVDIVANFLKGLPKSRFQLVSLTIEDIQRSADILLTYKDSQIDFVDATVMAVAERNNISTVLTLDKRDFQIFRPLHCAYFELLPV